MTDLRVLWALLAPVLTPFLIAALLMVAVTVVWLRHLHGGMIRGVSVTPVRKSRCRS